MEPTLRDVGEAALVARIAAAFRPNASVVLGIGDDAALVRPTTRDGALVTAADAMVEGVHFDRRWSPPEAVGHKLVHTNLSDLAAMGARPEWALLTCGFPPSLPAAWAEALIDAIGAACAAVDVAVVGGDVTGSPGPVILSFTLSGAPGPRVLRRTDARAGHGLFTTGVVGGAALGLRALATALPSPLAVPQAVQRQLTPNARLDEGHRLAACDRVGACMDLSDGLACDLPRLARASGVGLRVHVDALPLHADLRHVPDAHSLAVTGGEDYELVFTCAGPPPIPATRIGDVTDDPPGVVWTRGGAPWHPSTAPFGHFGVADGAARPTTGRSSA